MSLQSPNLDDRRFDDLVDEARQHIIQKCPEWTDLSPNDPGMVLLELFAYLTETMLYRLNRIPEKAYIEFLRLIGVKLQPPSAATVTLCFTLSRPQNKPVEIARGTRVTTDRAADNTEPPVFSTAETMVVAPGDTEVKVRAYHCNLVEAEFAGQTTGLPGFSVIARHTPLISPTGDELDLVVGIEAEKDQIDSRVPALQYEGKAYRVWHEVDNFTNLGPDRCVYVADRITGTISFAPAVRMREEDGSLPETPQALAEIPAAGRNVRLWYRSGGGPDGNVAANTLTKLKDPIPGVEVSNPQSALGGRLAESLENALIRGPQELHSLQRAVTARDYELVAVHSSGAVNRAKAFTRARLWSHAKPGTVEVLLVPNVPESKGHIRHISTENLEQNQTGSTRTQIQKALDKRRPLGTECVVNWARYKKVRVKARVIVHREEDPASVEPRVLERLYETINPLSSPPNTAGWPFGQTLKAWDVYKIMGSEPGVSSVEDMRLLVEEVPGKEVRALCADAFQFDTWYAATGEHLFRSLNNGDGWELIGRFPGQEVDLVKSYPKEASPDKRHTGLVAVTAQIEKKNSHLHISRDCGETWEPGPKTQFPIKDMAWIDRDGIPALLLATEAGLYEFSLQPEAVPEPILVDPQDQTLGFYAVAVSADLGGSTSVAVAARAKKGVFLSSDGGKSGSFDNIGLKDELVRVLSVQHRGPYRYLWAGIAAPGADHGKGCFRWLLTGSTEGPEGWRPYHKGWKAGGCRSLAFQGSKVLAASLRLGVLYLDVDVRDPEWEAPDVNCGLPLRDVGRLQPVDVVASARNNEVLLAGGIAGVFSSSDQGLQYKHCSQNEFRDEVTLPETWLFYSGEHEINVVRENETERD